MKVGQEMKKDTTDSFQKVKDVKKGANKVVKEGEKVIEGAKDGLKE